MALTLFTSTISYGGHKCKYRRRLLQFEDRTAIRPASVAFDCELVGIILIGARKLRPLLLDRDGKK